VFGNALEPGLSCFLYTTTQVVDFSFNKSFRSGFIFGKAKLFPLQR